MAELVHRTLSVHGTRVHAVEAGTGPLVVLVHGFPETWYSWRHQLPALAEAGYRAVALDVRGYGRSSKPAAVEDYRMVCHVADVVGTVEELGGAPAVLVGHDWGAPIAWSCCLVRPELFRGLVLLSVPYSPRGRTRPTDAYRRMGGEEEFYIAYFQHPGRAESEIEPDVRGFLLGFYFTASGEAPAPEPGRTMATIPKGGRMRDRLVVPERLPSFLTEEDLEHYVGEFERGGFTGPLNRYRNVDRDWEDFAAFTGAPIGLPSLFIGGERDGPTVWGARAIERFETTLPGLRGCHVLQGCGHWVQQERPDEVTSLLVEFLDSLGPRPRGGSPAPR